jgi:hypothetical protein
MTYLRVFFIAIMSLLCIPAAASPEADFWKWFQKNETMLFDFEKNPQSVFDQLQVEMHKVNSTLTFEFGPKQGGQREFVISADGIRDAFPSVEKLYTAAPPLKKWKVLKFRPRRAPFDISFQGVSVKEESVRVLVERGGPGASLTVLMPGYTSAKHETFLAIAYLFLDQALGEYDVETRVGHIAIAGSVERQAKSISLKNLPATFDALFAR